MLMTAPLRDWQVVLAKYLADFAFYLPLGVPTFLYLPVLLDFDLGTMQIGIDPFPVLSSYLGLALAGAMFLALGLFVSNLVRSQMVAALISLALGIGANTALFSGVNGLLLRTVSIPHPETLVRLRHAGKNDMRTSSSGPRSCSKPRPRPSNRRLASMSTTSSAR